MRGGDLSEVGEDVSDEVEGFAQVANVSWGGGVLALAMEVDWA